MKTGMTIVAVLCCMLTIGGSCAVAIRPVECLLIVEKVKRAYKDFETAGYVDGIIKDKEKQRELRSVHD
jgi:hypothetical protein